MPNVFCVFTRGDKGKVSDVYRNCQLGGYGKRRSYTCVGWGGEGMELKQIVKFFVLTVMCFEE